MKRAISSIVAGTTFLAAYRGSPARAAIPVIDEPALAGWATQAQQMAAWETGVNRLVRAVIVIGLMTAANYQTFIATPVDNCPELD
jgi:hypothetical protein